MRPKNAYLFLLSFFIKKNPEKLFKKVDLYKQQKIPEFRGFSPFLLFRKVDLYKQQKSLKNRGFQVSNKVYIHKQTYFLVFIVNIGCILGKLRAKMKLFCFFCAKNRPV